MHGAMYALDNIISINLTTLLHGYIYLVLAAIYLVYKMSTEDTSMDGAMTTVLMQGPPIAALQGTIVLTVTSQGVSKMPTRKADHGVYIGQFMDIVLECSYNVVQILHGGQIQSHMT